MATRLYYGVKPVDLRSAVLAFERAYGNQALPEMGDKRYRNPFGFYHGQDPFLGELFIAFYHGLVDNPDPTKPSEPSIPNKLRIKALLSREAKETIQKIREAYLNGVKASGFWEALEEKTTSTTH